MRWRHGRHRSPRSVEHIPEVRYFKPAGVPMRELELVELSYAEVEAIRLSDLEGLTQEQAAARMGISRRSFWNDITTARKKVAYALTEGCAIQIVNGVHRDHPNKQKEEEKCQEETEQDHGEKDQ
ncbi:MAG: DUF134 domain-containing protein [Thermoplasmatota archaeon]